MANEVVLSLHTFTLDQNLNQQLIDPVIKGFIRIFYIDGIISNNNLAWQSFTAQQALDSGGPVKVVGTEYQLHEPNKNIYSSLIGFSLFGFVQTDIYDIVINPGRIPMKAVLYKYAMIKQTVAGRDRKVLHGLKQLIA